ncbi:hypothetical protein LTR08_008031 [Meristemomyces frigidus]|nr:hypothetical protein LTR08_008031 [Meristemomyces frigidus]
MSVVTLSAAAPKLTPSQIHTLSATAGLTINEAHVDDFARLLGALDESVQSVLAAADYVPHLDLTKYPRTAIKYIPDHPELSDKGGWASRCLATCTAPTNARLKGRTVALKDNVALAGVRCTNGTAAMAWTPALDATIATRILDAGATITGKAACENACMEGVSDTSVTGSVQNPYAEGYSCGGSSSGSGRLVAVGAVDMAVGCDQGGSIRIPASMCGIVGLKPTWGLVPYTGIISLESTIDHAGPMTTTVRDAALLLETLAGPDAIDDRQPAYLPPGTLAYTQNLALALASAPNPAQPLTGTTIGVLAEGFALPDMAPSIHALCTSAVSKLKTLGATITDISVPAHTNAAVVWMLSLPIAGGKQGLLSDLTGRKQLFLTDRVRASPRRQLSQAAFDALGPGGQNLWLRHLYLSEKYGPELHAKCANLLRKISDDYDRALDSVDVLVMPTLPSPPCKLFEHPAAHGPLERLGRNVGLVGNTAPFNSTGHPALTIPVGFVPALDDAAVKLPAGLQIVGRKFGDGECLRVGAAWEAAFDWKTL